MIKRRFVAKDARRAMAMIQNTLGSNAVIFSNRRIPEGVEIIAGLEEDPAVAEQLDAFPKTPAPALQTRNPIAPTPTLEPQDSFTIGPDKFIDETPAPAPHVFQFQEEITLQKDHEVERLKQEVSLLRDMLEGQIIQTLSRQMPKGNPKQLLLKQKLISLGLDTELAEQLTLHISADDSMMHAWDTIRAELNQAIIVPQQEIIDTKKIIALIGATGVGKTTTIAKLATRFVLRYHPDELGLITTDFNRVAAQGQLMLYGQILGVETLTVFREEELRKALHKMQDKRLVLIDTAGVSQKDNLNIARLLSIFNQNHHVIDAYLTLSCTSQLEVLDETIRAFQSASLSGCILTKADEAASLIPAISTIIKHHLPLTYITHGQRIPQDIRLAMPDELTDSVLAGHTDTAVTESHSNQIELLNEI